MLRLTELKLPLDHAADALRPAICQRLGIADTDLIDFSLFRRGYDARKKSAITLIYTVDCTLRDEAAVFKRLDCDRNIGPTPDMAYKVVAQAPADLKERPIVIGMGPCGFMAALLLAQMGFRPIVLERGKIVRERTKDTWGLWRRNTLNPESNVQFGEGGAGTFSDGKLYSQIKDPNFYGRKVLEEFVKAGAPEEIIYVSKPHVGTFRLVKMVENIRQNIVDLGGEIRFEAKVDQLLRDNSQVVGVELAGGERLMSRHVVLAVGHSARDTFQMLYDAGVYIEAKPFAIGFRVEHPQTLVDHARFGPNAGNEILGAADYKLVHHCKNGRAAYSFCMCPGGQVVAATSEPGRVVTNGMSQYSRAERNANSALVVNIDPEDFPGDFKKNPLIGMDFQRHWEAAAFVAGGGDYSAPAQKIGDFLAGRPSTAPGTVEPSYQPGVRWTDLGSCVPTYVTEALREAIPAFDRQIKGFAMADAVLTGVETRTSSPIRIKRGADYQSINTRGLYPAGEGAGYAGGILSAGVDGIKVAEAVALSMVNAEKNLA
ncbi:NAD(P)/FAD-dependent oxidoreductase [Dechloromonas sp. XY25]|uniref:NAD(P)/FAD-dependent oxidoreductase n=1 Tax=Dechloromonas hankyongensis TaxID=2908002 RepID=A0ABS9K531_9RHOO|nr:NAD(P)/FAD-dependent oxidoreductase [Dechloromonas hankyongensis]MCG2578279.1 NAD(P)/FAD-dependent oxidoreductase [Dechloromonas hankyongensis]